MEVIHWSFDTAVRADISAHRDEQRSNGRGADMSRQESEASLHNRFLGRIEVLTPWWSDRLSSLQRHYFPVGGLYSSQRQVDVMLSAIALGASRWALRPHARIRRRKSFDRHHELQKGLCSAQEWEVRELVELLAVCIQRGAAQSTADCRFEGEMPALIVTVQLGAMQCAASEVFSALYPSAAVIETLRLLLLEQLPSPFLWCA